MVCTNIGMQGITTPIEVPVNTALTTTAGNFESNFSALPLNFAL